MKYSPSLLLIAFALFFGFNIAFVVIIRTERKENLKLKMLLQTSNDSNLRLEYSRDNLFLNSSIMFELNSEI